MFDGAVQLRFIWDDDTVVAASPVGEPGMVVEPDPVSRSATSVEKYDGNTSYGS